MSDKNAADVFNDLILSYCLVAADKLGLLEFLPNGISIEGYAVSQHLDLGRLQVLVNILTAHSVITETNGRYQLTALGRQLQQNIGFFTWAIGGYSPLLESIATITSKPDMPWRTLVRGEAVAVGSDQAHRGIMAPVINHVLDGLSATCVADLGCGNAGRLAEFLTSRPGVSGVGIDIDDQAITAAKRLLESKGILDRVTLVNQNVFESLAQPSPQFARVDLVVSFMMLHDLFNISELDGKLFAALRRAFPGATHYVMADTCRAEIGDPTIKYPVFTQGFELIHSLRGIKTFPLDYYLNRFEAENMKVESYHNLGVPNTYLFVLGVT